MENRFQEIDQDDTERHFINLVVSFLEESGKLTTGICREDLFFGMIPRRKGRNGTFVMHCTHPYTQILFAKDAFLIETSDLVVHAHKLTCKEENFTMVEADKILVEAVVDYVWDRLDQHNVLGDLTNLTNSTTDEVNEKS